MTVTEFLSGKVPFLAGLGQEEAHRLARAAEQLQCRRGQDLLARGAPLPGLLVVATGRLGGAGAGLGPGDVFGAACLLGPATSAATLRAEEDSLVFAIPAAAFAGLLDRRPELRERARGADGGAGAAPLERFTTLRGRVLHHPEKQRKPLRPRRHEAGPLFLRTVRGGARLRRIGGREEAARGLRGHDPEQRVATHALARPQKEGDHEYKKEVSVQG